MRGKDREERGGGGQKKKVRMPGRKGVRKPTSRRKRRQIGLSKETQLLHTQGSEKKEQGGGAVSSDVFHSGVRRR